MGKGIWLSFNKTPQILYSEIVFSKQDLYYYWGSFIFVLGVIGAFSFHGWKQDVPDVGAHREGYYDSLLTSEGALEDSGCPDSLASERW